MSSPDKHIGSWSMEDVHKYLRGELSDREMHQLEKAALDDPFLADALEGLATRATSSSPSPLDQDLPELTARLEARVAEKKSRILALPRIRVAAAILLLAGIGTATWFTLNTNRQDLSKAVTVSSRPAAKAPAAEAPTTTAPAPSPAAAESAVPSPSESESDKEHAIARAERPRKTRRAQTAPPIAAENTAAKNTAASDIAALQPFSLKRDSISFNPSAIGNSKPGLHTEPLLFSGKVLDVNNHPLAGVSLVLEGKTKGTVTDEAGYFKLYVPPHDTLRKLNVDFAGYDETTVALNNDNRLSNVITLKERPSAFSEVVVTGLGMKRKEVMAASPSDDVEKLDSLWTSAIPATGRTAYLDYLATAKKGLDTDSTIRGIVSISFLVDQKGDLTDFKIERSLSPAQDAGIIRLISEGPSWKLLHGKKARLLVSVTFP